MRAPTVEPRGARRSSWRLRQPSLGASAGALALALTGWGPPAAAAEPAEAATPMAAATPTAAATPAAAGAEPMAATAKPVAAAASPMAAGAKPVAAAAPTAQQQASAASAPPSSGGAQPSAAATLDTPASPGDDTSPTRAAANGRVDPRDALRLRPAGKDWRLVGEAHYRSLLVTDEDPANDRYLLYRLQGTYFPLPWLGVFARVGLFQRFVAVDGESGLRLEDTELGATAEQRVALAPWGGDRTLLLSHALRVFLPTSFTSAQQDLYFAGEWSTRAQLRVWDQLVAGARGIVHYRFHEYAEQAGPGGATLPRLVLSARPFVEYTVLDGLQGLGTLTFGASLYGDQTFDYPARDPADLGAEELPPGTLTASDVRGAGSSDSFLDPHYGYALYGVYTLPNRHLSVVLSLEQNGSVVRYGEPRLYFIHRDQTELVLALVGNY